MGTQKCPHKIDTEYENSICALRYRNAQLETCINPKTKPGFGDSFCKNCLIGKSLNIVNNNDQPNPMRIPQTTMATDINITIDRNREFELEGTKLFAIINTKGRNTNSPRLANESGEVVAKVCNLCIKPKWLSEYYDQERPCICKKCFNSRPKKKKKINIVEDKETIKSDVVSPSIVSNNDNSSDRDKQKDIIPEASEKISYILTHNSNTHELGKAIAEKISLDISKSENIIPKEIKEKVDNKDKIKNIIYNMIDIRMMTFEKQITSQIDSRFNELEKLIDEKFKELKKNVLLEIGTALLLEAKK